MSYYVCDVSRNIEYFLRCEMLPNSRIRHARFNGGETFLFREKHISWRFRCYSHVKHFCYVFFSAEMDVPTKR